MSTIFCELCSKPSSCWLCPSCIWKVRRYRQKKAAVDLLGSSCTRCGWAGDIHAFDFHHLHDKKFSIANEVNKSWDLLLPEIKKCELLCARCHRIESSEFKRIPVIREAKSNRKTVVISGFDPVVLREKVIAEFGMATLHDERVLLSLVENGLSTYRIAAITNSSQTNVRHFLKKYDLSSRICRPSISSRPRFIRATPVSCPSCGRDNKHKSSLCSSCTGVLRRFNLKTLAVEYKNGECQDCGWRGSVECFDFHHTDGKDYALSSKMGSSFDKIKLELDKTILLCACCHRLRHSQKYSEKLISITSRYRGRKLQG